MAKHVIFETLAFLIARPVHEEAIIGVHHHDGHDHVAHDSEGGDSSEEPDDQAESAEELGTNGEKGEGCRNSHLMSEEAHGAAEAVSAKPAQHFLRAVREEYYVQPSTKNGYGVSHFWCALFFAT